MVTQCKLLTVTGTKTSGVFLIFGSLQARRHGFRAGGARKIWRALSLFFDDYGLRRSINYSIVLY